MTTNESERISLCAAINERVKNLVAQEQYLSDVGDLGHTGAAVLLVDSLKSQITDLRAQLLENLDAALAERQSRLNVIDRNLWQFPALRGTSTATERRALKSQIRDLETEKHALLQELPL